MSARAELHLHDGDEAVDGVHRRHPPGQLDLHLVYKALFEMSVDRADFVSRLFSQAAGRPHGQIERRRDLGAFRASEKAALYAENLKAIQTHWPPGGFLLRTDRSGIGKSTTRFPPSAHTFSTRPPAPDSSAAGSSRHTRT